MNSYILLYNFQSDTLQMPKRLRNIRVFDWTFTDDYNRMRRRFGYAQNGRYALWISEQAYLAFKKTPRYGVDGVDLITRKYPIR